MQNLFVEIDVDEGHDWDIPDINEGLWHTSFPFCSPGWFCRSPDINCVFCSVVVGLNLLEGDIQQDEVRPAATEDSSLPLE